MEGHHGSSPHGQLHQSPNLNAASPVQYSTLEVVPNNHPHNAPEVAYPTAPEPVPTEYYAQNKEQVSPSYASSAVGKPSPSPYGYAASPGGDQAGQFQGMAPPVHEPLEETPKKTVTMKKRTMWILIAIAAVVVVGAAVGGAVGGVMVSRKDSSSSQPAPTTTATPDANTPSSGSTNGTANSAVLASSALAAVNFTVGTTDYKMLFWQPSTNQTDIVYSLWDSSARGSGWNRISIQSKLTGSTAVEAKPGTPISATVRPRIGGNGQHALSIFYLSASNVVQELHTGDPKGDSWEKTTHSITADKDSQLAARYDVCGGSTMKCSGSMAVAYEDEQERQNWYWPGAAPEAKNFTAQYTTKIIPGSGIAVASLAFLTNNTDDFHLKLYFQNSTSRNLVEVTRDSKPLWYITQSSLVRNLPVDNPSQVYAMGFYKDGVREQYLFVLLRAHDGTLQALHWNGNSWRQSVEPVVRNQPSGLGKNFTAVAITNDMTVYGVAPDGNTIHVFNIDKGDPITWTYGTPIKLN